MSRLQPAASQPAADHDIEAPALAAAASAADSPRIFEMELFERMPHLRHPDLLASMTRDVSDVAQTRFVLQSLGERPVHEAVDAAGARLADIDAVILRQLEEIARATFPEGADSSARRAELAEREKECRARGETEPYKAVIKLNEMHEAHEKLLKDAEERLEKLYGSATGNGVTSMQREEEEDEQVNEEVVAILQDASVKCVERVELSARGFRYLPEAFGKIRGLLVLDVSNNRLEKTCC